MGGHHFAQLPVLSWALFWLLFQSSRLTSAASKACRIPGCGLPSAMPLVEKAAQTMPVPCADPLA